MNSNAVMPLAAQSSQPGGSFQAVLANASDDGDPANDATSPGTQANGEEGVTSRKAKEHAEHLHSVPGTGSTRASGSVSRGDRTGASAQNGVSGDEADQMSSDNPSSDGVSPFIAQATAQQSKSQEAAAGPQLLTLTASIIQPSQVQNGLPGIDSQAALAGTPGQQLSGASLAAAGAKASVRAGTATRPPIEPEKAQPLPLVGNAAAVAATAVLPTTQGALSAADISDVWRGQETGHGQGGQVSERSGFSGSSMDTAAAVISTEPSGVPPHLLVSHVAPERLPVTEQTSSLTQPSDSAGPGDGSATATGTTDNAGLTAIMSLPGAGETALSLNLPMSSMQPNGVGGGPIADKAAAKQAGDPASAKNPILSGTADSAKNQTAQAAGGSGAAAATPQNNSQVSPGPQTVPSQAGAIMQRVADSSVSQVQIQADVTHTGSPEPTNAHRAPDGLDAMSRPGEQPGVPGSAHLDGSEAAAASGIDSAKLMQTMSGAEMRVGVHSTEFGDISIRTSISQQQMLAHISVDHSDLGQAIAAHIAPMQTRLGNEYGLQATVVINHQGSSSLSGETGQSSQREQRAFTSSVGTESAAVPVESDSGMGLEALAGAAAGQRLSIQA